jgi:cysteinyl-tRNA synthetase
MTPGQQGQGARFDSMELKLYDTLTREKRVFAPIDRANVRMYVCGPTVYDFAHIGNARPVIVFDVLFRLLRHLYGAEHVTYVRNITDVDDKINARAAEEYPGLPLNEAIRKVTEKTDRQFHEDVAALGCLPPTAEPRATEHIAEMRALIEQLVASGNAYVEHDHVLFRVDSMPDYGKLSKRPLDEMIAGARVEVAPYKRGPMDFVLWKPSKAGEPAWPSPCGITAPGRPGWHIECSAMADKWLWSEALAKLSASGRAHPHQFDIHGGGIDLVFPHHENEIAQSRSAFHTPAMANFWMHNGFLQVEGEKMSKSLGNFVTIRDLLKQSSDPRWGEILRLNMLRTHYRQPIDWTNDGVAESAATYGNFRRAAIYADRVKVRPSQSVLAALSDDLNTPAVLAELHRLGHLALGTSGAPADAAAELVGSLLLLGFDRAVDHVRAGSTRGDVEKSFQEVSARERGLDPAEINSRIADRIAARSAKNFKESDRIRDELAKMGVVLKDTKDGTTWEIAR